MPRRLPTGASSGRPDATAAPTPPFSAVAAAPSLLASRQLRAEHRRIEQTLALLLSDPDIERATLRRCAYDVAAHLRADASLLYPIVERAWHRPIVELRDLQQRMRLLLAKITAKNVDPRWRKARLRELEAAFRDHARLEDEAALPWLEGATSTASLEDLGRRFRTFRATLLERRLQREKTARTPGAPREKFRGF
jgi:hypothetical protein